MIRLRVFSVFLLLVCVSLVVAQTFGEVDAKDEQGNVIEPTITENGGKTYTIDEGNQLTVNYQGTSTDYGNLAGDITFSEAGKLVSGNFQVKGDGTYVLGNLKVPLKSGAQVTFEDGELTINDPGSVMKKEDIAVIDSDSGWDENSITLTGSGVDYMGLETVSLDEYGYFVKDPKGITFDEFTVYGDGNVYLISDEGGEKNVEVMGAYVSVDPQNGKFTIGSNVVGDSVAVSPKKDNSYGLRYDVDTDHISLRSIGSVNPSYVTVTNREAKGLVPNVDTVGLFAIDDNSKAVYRDEEGTIFTKPSGNVNTMVAASGTTMSPVEIHFYDFIDGKQTKIDQYGGAVLFGNDGGMGYGYNGFALGGKYGNKGGPANAMRGSGGYELNYGIANSLLYNYNLDEAALEKLFKVKITDNIGYLKDPEHVKWVADTLARFPKATKALRTLTFSGSGGAQGVTYNGRYITLYNGGHTPAVLAHELVHVFDHSASGSAFDSDWASIGGGGAVRSYGNSNTAEAKATVGEYTFLSDAAWKSIFQRSTGSKNAARVAALAKHGYLQDYDAARILKNAGLTIDEKDPISSYNKIISGTV